MSLEREPDVSDLYTYRATIESIHDGDTVWAFVDHGQELFTRKRYRLAGIKAPELEKDEQRGPGWRSKAYLEHLIDRGRPVLVRTIKAARSESEKIEKWGRYLIEIWQDGVCINDQMITDGYAEKWIL